VRLAGRLARHRAVDEDRQIRQHARACTGREGRDQLLRAPHRERRHDHAAPARDGALDDLDQRLSVSAPAV
jgi:hypothetical protein